MFVPLHTLQEQKQRESSNSAPSTSFPTNAAPSDTVSSVPFFPKSLKRSAGSSPSIRARPTSNGIHIAPYRVSSQETSPATLLRAPISANVLEADSVAFYNTATSSSSRRPAPASASFTKHARHRSEASRLRAQAVALHNLHANALLAPSAAERDRLMADLEKVKSKLNPALYASLAEGPYGGGHGGFRRTETEEERELKDRQDFWDQARHGRMGGWIHTTVWLPGEREHMLQRKGRDVTELLVEVAEIRIEDEKL